MAFTWRLMQPIRASISAISLRAPVISRSKPPDCANLGILKTWIKDLQTARTSKFSCKLCSYGAGNLGFKWGTLFSTSIVFGLVHFGPRLTYTLDGNGTVGDDESAHMLYNSDIQDASNAFWIFIRKLWLPVFFFVTVLVNWDHPIELAMRVILFLLSTKPSPLSVYLTVEQSSYAKKVEVQDYKLFCLAKVEMQDHEFIFVGVLGGWWPLQSFLCEGKLLDLQNGDQKYH